MAGLQDLLMGGMKSGALGVVPQMMAGGDAGGIGGLPIGIGLMQLMKGMNQQQQPQQQPNQEPPAWYTEAPQWMQELPAQQREQYQSPWSVSRNFNGRVNGIGYRGVPADEQLRRLNPNAPVPM